MIRTKMDLLNSIIELKSSLHENQVLLKSDLSKDKIDFIKFDTITSMRLISLELDALSKMVLEEPFSSNEISNLKVSFIFRLIEIIKERIYNLDPFFNNDCFGNLDDIYFPNYK